MKQLAPFYEQIYASHSCNEAAGGGRLLVLEENVLKS